MTENHCPSTPPAIPSKHPRAGRNLFAAIIVGLALAGMLLASLTLATQLHLWVLVLAVVCPIATYELCCRFREAGYTIPYVPIAIGGQAIIWASWPPWGATGVLTAFGGTVVTCMIWCLINHGLNHAPQQYVIDLSATIFITIWVSLFMGFAALLVYPENGPDRVLCLLLTVIFSDVSGYACGVLFGKHRMVPAISPNKSWEGFVGSLLCGTCASVCAVKFLLHQPAWIGIPLGILLVVSGVFGDLVESQVKRDLGIKDMGRILPGHGGLMDRLDGLLPSAVVAWLVFALLL